MLLYRCYILTKVKYNIYMKFNLNIVLSSIVIVLMPVFAYTQNVRPLSFEDALNLLQSGNQSLQIADKEIEIAKNEKDKLNAFWYPSLQASGAYTYLSQKIEVKEPLSQFTNPVSDFVHSILPDDQIITNLLNQIGSNSLIVPLAPRNLVTVDVNAEWIIFSGLKRFRATKIGRTMVDIAQENKNQIDANQRTLLVEAYYGLKLAQQVVKVRMETYSAFKKHYENALKLEATGMIDKAGRLLAQVNMDEAKRELEAAEKNESVVQNSLKTILNIESNEANIIPTSHLFINESLPSKYEFIETLNTNNYLINQLNLQEQIAKEQTKIDQAGYMPNIAFFGKQTLYSHGIQSNLIPRLVIGVGFTWNLFDGLEREKRIRQSKLTRQTLLLGQEKAKDDFAVGVDNFYSQLEKSLDNVAALNTTIELSEELVRIRKKAFLEGMATSLEVIDAETLLAKVRIAKLAAYYEYEVALINLLAICGIPEKFSSYNY